MDKKSNRRLNDSLLDVGDVVAVEARRHAVGLARLVVLAAAGLVELHVHAERKKHDNGHEVAPPRARDRDDRGAVEIFRGVVLEIRAVRERAGKVPYAPGDRDRAHKAGRHHEHGLLELEREHAANQAQPNREQHEHDVRVLFVQLVRHGRVDREREQHAAGGAGDEQARGVERHANAAHDDAAGKERDPRGRLEVGLVLEHKLDRAGDRDAADDEAAEENCGTEEAVPGHAHGAAGEHGADREDGRPELDFVGGPEDGQRRLAGLGGHGLHEQRDREQQREAERVRGAHSGVRRRRMGGEGRRIQSEKKEGRVSSSAASSALEELTRCVSHVFALGNKEFSNVIG